MKNTNTQSHEDWAIVTGGSEGIGKAISQELAAMGLNVFILARDPVKLEQALPSIRSCAISKSQNFESRVCDVTKWDDVQRFAAEFQNEYGAPKILVNNAGFALPGYIQDQTVDDYHAMMNTNYFGIVHMCKAFVDGMIKAKRGQILNVSSMAGFLGLFGYSAYCGSKFAVVGFSESLKRELKPFNISVSVLCPPNTRTPGLERENLSKPKEVLLTEEKAKTVDPKLVAREAVKGLAKNQFMIVPTFDGGLAYRLNRYVPAIIEQFVKRPSAPQ